jgi:hypothetical protein
MGDKISLFLIENAARFKWCPRNGFIQDSHLFIEQLECVVDKNQSIINLAD